MTELVENCTEYGTDFAIEDESVAIYHMNEERVLWLTKKDLLTMLELIEQEKFMKFTKEQALAIMGFTGITTTNFSTFHEDVEKRMGHPVWTHQFADQEFSDKVKALYKDEFLSYCCEDYK